MFPKIPDVSNILEFCEPLIHMFQHAIKVCTRPQTMGNWPNPFTKKCQSPIHGGPSRVLMSSLCVPCYMQCRLTVTHWHACKCSGKEQVSVVLQEPFDKSSSQKTALVKWHTDCKSQLQEQGALQTLKLVCVSCFVCFVSFRLKFHMIASSHFATCSHRLLNHSRHRSQAPKASFPPFCHGLQGSNKNLKHNNLQLAHSSVPSRTLTNRLISNHGIDDLIEQSSLLIIFFWKKKSVPTELTRSNLLHYLCFHLAKVSQSSYFHLKKAELEVVESVTPLNIRGTPDWRMGRTQIDPGGMDIWLDSMMRPQLFHLWWGESYPKTNAILHWVQTEITLLDSAKKNGFVASMQTCNSIASSCGLTLTANLSPCWSLDCELCRLQFFQTNDLQVYSQLPTQHDNSTRLNSQFHYSKANCPSVTWATQTHRLLKIPFLLSPLHFKLEFQIKIIPNTPWSAQLLYLDPDQLNELGGHLTNTV